MLSVQRARPSRQVIRARPLVPAISLGLGALAGDGARVLHDPMGRVFRTVEQIRDELGLDVLGMLPDV